MEFKPEYIEKLCKLEIFSDFNPSNPEHAELMKKVFSKLKFKNFKAGDLILKEGAIGDSLYILHEGTVQIKKNTPGNDQFAVVNLTSEQNVFFGEVALIDKDNRSASVYALTDCRTMYITGKDFQSLCEENYMLGYYVMYRISKRIASSLRRSNKDLLTLYVALLDEVNGNS
ncbi:MAG: cyclic nucleotide-binding domain-containing protein [Treponema sp.]|nr:cyclic nucleotide-binding domain-containing protein [Treponema sp.]